MESDSQQDSHALLLSLLRLTLQRCLQATCAQRWSEQCTAAVREEHRIFAESSNAEYNSKPLGGRKHGMLIHDIPVEVQRRPQGQEAPQPPIWSQVEVFGSRALGGHLPGGDVDCVMFVPSYCGFDMFASFCEVYLPLAGFSVKAKVQLARVPLLKVEFGPWEADILQVDMNLVLPPTEIQLLQTAIFDKVTPATRPSLNGVRTVLLLKQMVPYSEEIYGAVLKAIKHWSTARRIYGTVSSYPGGVGLAVLVAKSCIDHYEKVTLEAAIRQSKHSKSKCVQLMHRKINRIRCGEEEKVGQVDKTTLTPEQEHQHLRWIERERIKRKAKKQQRGAKQKPNRRNHGQREVDSTDSEREEEAPEGDKNLEDEVRTWPRQVIIDSLTVHFFELYSEYFEDLVTKATKATTDGGAFNSFNSLHVEPIFVTKHYEPEREVDKKTGERYNRFIENMQDCWGTNSAHFQEKVVVLNPAYPYVNTCYAVGSSGVGAWEEELNEATRRIREHLAPIAAGTVGGGGSGTQEEERRHALDIGRTLNSLFQRKAGARLSIPNLSVGRSLYQEVSLQQQQQQQQQGGGGEGRYRLVSIQYDVPAGGGGGGKTSSVGALSLSGQKQWEFAGYVESKYKFFVYALEHTLGQAAGQSRDQSPQMRVWPKRYNTSGGKLERIQYFVLLSNCGRCSSDEAEAVTLQRDRWLAEAVQRACLEWASVVKNGLGDGYNSFFLESSFTARLGEGSDVGDLLEAERRSQGAEQLVVDAGAETKIQSVVSSAKETTRKGNNSSQEESAIVYTERQKRERGEE